VDIMLATMKAEVRWQSVCITWMYFDQSFFTVVEVTEALLYND
jgi:hypothetical protein